MNKSKIPTVVGIIVLIIGLAVAVFLLQQQQIFRLGASPDRMPKDVRTTNVNDTSFTISWTTDKETVGFVEWGADENTPQTANEENNTAKNIHSVTVRNASANKTYFFRVNSDGNSYDNNGALWQVKTGPQLTTPPGAILISGTIFQENGQPAPNALVYVNASGVTPLSAFTTSAGKWAVPLSASRSTSLTDYAEVNNNTLVEIFVQGGPVGIATAQAYVAGADPLPAITLGKVHDFRDQTNAPSDGELPDSELELPEDEDKASRFQSDATDSTTQPDQVTLESIEEGEIVYSVQPEFFGAAPAGETITITVESDPITDDIAVPEDGNWRWSPPEGLEPGEHTVTLKWRDASGILRTLTRSFIVSAAEDGPAFESTPSATPTTTSTPTPKPTASPTSTPKPSVTPSATASSTPRVTTPSTDSAIPTPGSTTQTIILFVIGVASIITGLVISKKAVF